MLTIKEILIFAFESAYDLSQKRNFSNPKIYTASGNLTKRWYVYFSFRDPKTGKLKRLTPLYGNSYRYKTKEERMEVFTVYRKTLLKLLRQGYNLFSDNTELHNRLYSKKTSSKPLSQNNYKQAHQESKSSNIDNMEEPKITLREAFDFGLKLKEKLISERTRN